MESIIVFVNDSAYARQTLAPLKHQALSIGASASATHWIVVACPPRLTRHVSKWLTHSARMQWRAKWSDKLFAEIAPMLKANGSTVQTLTAQGSLVELTDRLLKQHGAAKVLDARLALVGQVLLPVTRDQPVGEGDCSVLPGAMPGMGPVLRLAAD